MHNCVGICYNSLSMEAEGLSTINPLSMNSLVLLFVFDKMDIPLTENTIIEMCCSRNEWLSYMDCKQAIGHLIIKAWIHKADGTGDEAASGDTYYAMTVDGRMCLAHLFYNIPSSLRAQIVDFVTENRMHFRRRQEYSRDYFPNPDGTYTVVLRIIDPSRPILDLSLNVDSRATAKAIFNKWEEKAAQIYAMIHENLIE